MIRRGALVYLALLPLTQWWVIPVAGIHASGADLLLAGVLAGALLAASTRGVAGRLFSGEWTVGEWTLVAYGIWVMVAASWSLHPEYAVVRGVATLSLALGVVAISRVVPSRESAMDAWLWGTVVLLAVVLPLAAVASWVPHLGASVLYTGGGIEGLPFPRLRGSLAHPNLLGDYLVVSGCILHVRWEEWRRERRLLAVAMVVGGSGALLLTASSAWLAGGPILVLVAWRQTRRRRGGLPWMVLAGSVLFTVCVAWALIQPMAVTVPWGSVSTDGNRWGIWRSAWQAVRTAPLMGVGSSPYLAQTFHPGRLWDAHSTYLSVAGQYGVVGLFLLLAGVGRLWWESRRASSLASESSAGSGKRSPAEWGPTVGLALMAVAVHGLVISGEDFRHHWALLALLAIPPGRSTGAANPLEGSASEVTHTADPDGKTG